MASSAFRLQAAESAAEGAIATEKPSGPRAHLVEGATCVLARVAVGLLVCVVSLELEADLAEWLRAVGIGEGERLTVLRRAAFGGPVHVRTSSGGEFALNSSLARCIHTEPSA